jgi:hypothetical protein
LLAVVDPTNLHAEGDHPLSPEPEVAKYLGVSANEVQALAEYAIDRLRVASPVAVMRAPHQVWVSYAFEIRHESRTAAATNFIS